jgi:hypothetical protein
VLTSQICPSLGHAGECQGRGRTCADGRARASPPAGIGAHHSAPPHQHIEVEGPFTAQHAPEAGTCLGHESMSLHNGKERAPPVCLQRHAGQALLRAASLDRVALLQAARQHNKISVPPITHQLVTFQWHSTSWAVPDNHSRAAACKILAGMQGQQGAWTTAGRGLFFRV